MPGDCAMNQKRMDSIGEWVYMEEKDLDEFLSVWISFRERQCSISAHGGQDKCLLDEPETEILKGYACGYVLRICGS